MENITIFFSSKLQNRLLEDGFIGTFPYQYKCICIYDLEDWVMLITHFDYSITHEIYLTEMAI